METTKFLRNTSAGGILLLLGTIVPAYAQHDEKGKGADPQEKGGQQHAPRAPRAEQPQRPQQQAPPQRAQQPPQQQQPQQPTRPQRADQPQRPAREQGPQHAQQPQPAPQQQPQQPQQTRPQRADQPQRPPREQAPQRAQEPQPVPQQQRVQRPQQAQPQERARQGAPPQTQRTQEQARSWQQQRGWLHNGGWQGHNNWQQDRAQHWASDHRTWAQRGGYGGYYIPRDRFNLYFGRQHVFRLHTTPVFYLGYPRFEYGGFSFLLLDPWPEYWPVNWYDSDDLYIDYDDYDGGYYLYDRRDPQVRLAVTVLL